MIALVFLALQSCKPVNPCNNDWEQVISTYQDNEKVVDYVELAKLNLALSETGQLADKVFHYTQAGYMGLLPDWGQKIENGELLSDIYYSMGHISLAQRMAFETDVLDDRPYNPAMMRRLIQTNIINGSYAVAKKYSGITGFDEFSKFLWDDAAVEADPEFGPKRRCIPSDDYISLVRGIDEDLKDIIRANPSYHKAVEYLGVMYLLDCEMDSFRAFLDEFYGSEALPELPESFAEAACMMSETDRGYWKEVGVSSGIHNKYREFKSRLGTGLSMDKYKDTFWYYIMKVNSQ